MNYLESLSKDEQYIISEIVNKWKEKTATTFGSNIAVSDKMGICLYELLEHLMLKNGIKAENISYSIDPEGGEIHLYHFFEKDYIRKNSGNNYEKRIKESVAEQIQSLILGCNFIFKLYDDGLIYFPEENFEESQFDDWYVPLDEYPKSLYIWEFSNIISRKVAKFLDKFLPSAILPSYQLIELFNNEFKTVEARRHEQQQSINDKALIRAKQANYIAIGIAMVSVIVAILCATLIPVSINSSQHKELIESIENLHNEQIKNEKR